MWTRLKSGDPVMLAGIMGSMVALVYTKPLSPSKAFCAAIGGTGAALFLSPAVASLLPTTFEPAVSFLIGVFSMSIIGIIFQVIEQAKCAPIKTIATIANIVIDVLLAFKHGVDAHNRRKDDHPVRGENNHDSEK